jgi:acetyltransferase-like isoleucine patch superfamily enzyme
MKKIVYLLRKLSIKIKSALFGGKLKAGKAFHIGKHCSIIPCRGAAITIGNCFLSRDSFCLRAEGGGVISIGNKVFLNSNVSITARQSIYIGDGSVIGPNVVIVDHDHNYRGNNLQEEFVSAPVYIGDNVWIGANCVILRGAKIGDNSIIAAGTVVRGTIPDHSLCYQKRENVIKNVEFMETSKNV